MNMDAGADDGDNDKDTTSNSSTTSSWIDVSKAQDGGVKKKILLAAPEGAAGPPPKNVEVTAHYTGTLASDGTKFDSSVDRGKPFKFTIGKGQVIKGWDEGFASMKVGEKALLEITPEYGYGKTVRVLSVLFKVGYEVLLPCGMWLFDTRVTSLDLRHAAHSIEHNTLRSHFL
jgi:FKBP-type peptidyl-prolyl cis-trans isomerase